MADQAPSSYATSNAAESIYTVGSPSKFDITVFPNASAINVVEKDKKKEKIEPPNPQLRSLQNVPQPMKIDEDKEDDIVINQQKSVAPTSKFGYQYPTKRDLYLRYASTAIAILSALLLVKSDCVQITYTNTYYYIYSSFQHQNPFRVHSISLKSHKNAKFCFHLFVKTL